MKNHHQSLTFYLFCCNHPAFNIFFWIQILTHIISFTVSPERYQIASLWAKIYDSIPYLISKFCSAINSKLFIKPEIVTFRKFSLLLLPPWHNVLRNQFNLWAYYLSFQGWSFTWFTHNELDGPFRKIYIFLVRTIQAYLV